MRFIPQAGRIAFLLTAACLPMASLAMSTGLYVGGTNLQLDIPDNDPQGVTSTLTAVPGDTILDEVPASGGLVQSVEVVLSLDHTWVGDLIFTITSPAGTTITLLDRPGTTDPGDFGDDANLIKREYVYFSDRALPPAEVMGTACLGSDDVVGIDCLSAFSPEDPTTAFAGEQLLGDWTLTLSDNAAGDLGALNGWYIEIDFVPVPVPASGWLLLSAGLGLSMLRRRRVAS